MSAHVRRAAWRALQEPRTRGLVYATLFIIVLGAAFYRAVEGWRWLDAFYFTVITLTTVGYGDLVPQSDAAKLFTMFYVFVGLGIIGSFAALIADARPIDPPLPGAAGLLRRPPPEDG
ncbi:MAG: two pore domain potassium channel family protein [Anaerolineae bacterium]|nr:two pore domain potassium channel family protein [Anaerolineae bacterium]